MRSTRKLAVIAGTRLLIAVAASAIVAGPANAQQYPAPGGPVVTTAPVLAAPPPVVPATSPLPPSPAAFLSGLQFIAYPYFWMAGLNMAITTPLARASQVNVSIGPGELLSDLNNAPFMGAAELRDGPFGILADAMHVPLGVPITTRNIFFSGGNSGVVMSQVTGDFLYRFLDQPSQTIDGGLGFRFWDVSTESF